ncbi:MAG: class E sortase, partial [Acidimicrobiia bacterium]|nr:class E sortase [Acidimicrobiia bacterium]
DDLKRGPGHYPQTPLPGQLGNAAIAGHRTSYGEPFAYIDQLQAGDEITVTTPAGTFIYVVDHLCRRRLTHRVAERHLRARHRRRQRPRFQNVGRVLPATF